MARPVHIVANTRLSTEAYGRMTDEMTKIVNGNGKQNTGFERNLSGATEKRLSLLQVHPTSREIIREGRITRHVLPLAGTIGTTDPIEIFGKAKTIEELRYEFSPLIKSMEEIVKDADVVLLSGGYYFPWSLFQAARNLHKPVVLCYAGILSKEITHLPENVQKMMKLMEKDFDDPLLYYIFPSSLTKATVEGIFGHALPRSEVIFNGVPPEFFDARFRMKKEKRVSFVGRCTSVKNPEFMVKLADEFEKRGSGYKVHMVTKPVDHYPFYYDLKNAPITMHSPMGTADLARFYGASSVIVSPSYFETYGNVPLEAISAGTHALVSPSMGVTEVFKHFDMTSYITMFDDVTAVVDKIEYLVKGKVRVPQSLRERIKNMLSWPAVVEKYIDICTEHSRKIFVQPEKTIAESIWN